MDWDLFAQLILLIMWVGLVTNLVANNITTHRWKEETKFYDHHKDLDHQEEPPPPLRKVGI